RSQMAQVPGLADEQPQSVAMVRISKSRALWVVALSFDAKRLFQPKDIQLMSLARQMLLNEQQHARLHERHRETLLGLIHGFTTTIDAKDHYTAGHSERVARIAVRLGQEMGLPSGVRSDLFLAGLLHDIGKIGIRDNLLLKATHLTPEEINA